MRRIAAPVVGGLLTAMILALIVVPVVYTLWREWQLRRGIFPSVIPESGAGTAAPALPATRS
jgi:copper/silver efflux system protein